MQDQYLLWKTEQSYYESRAAIWKIEVYFLFSSLCEICLMLQQVQIDGSTMKLALQGLQTRLCLLPVVMFCDDVTQTIVCLIILGHRDKQSDSNWLIQEEQRHEMWKAVEVSAICNGWSNAVCWDQSGAPTQTS